MNCTLVDLITMLIRREIAVTRRRRRPSVERTGDDRVHLASSSPGVGDSKGFRAGGGGRGVI